MPHQASKIPVMNLIDIIATSSLSFLVWGLNRFPLPFRQALISAIMRLVFALKPSYRRIAFKNLNLVFPNKSLEEKQQIYRASINSFARIFVDLARLYTLDDNWVKTQVEFPNREVYERIKREYPNTGIVFATGHLGSFEVLALCLAIFGHPISFVMRNFNLPRINEWWKNKREVRGNRAIDRSGAVKQVIRDLSNGRDVGILFDQNITRNHAVFVSFFGRLAATTKLVGLAALRASAPVMAISISYLGDDRYRVNALEVDCKDIYQDANLTRDQKVEIITQRVSSEYEKMVLENPEEWFWFHRRWKTTPEGQAEDFYKTDL
jgi:Kdo2-lipid IVA lauroyltransferase/acyltransferase